MPWKITGNEIITSHALRRTGHSGSIERSSKQKPGVSLAYRGRRWRQHLAHLVLLLLVWKTRKWESGRRRTLVSTWAQLFEDNFYHRTLAARLLNHVYFDSGWSYVACQGLTYCLPLLYFSPWSVDDHLDFFRPVVLGLVCRGSILALVEFFNQETWICTDMTILFSWRDFYEARCWWWRTWATSRRQRRAAAITTL